MVKKKRISTQLEQEGAEHLVIGNLLRFKIQSFLCPKNFENYDLIAVNPKKNLMKKIQVKSRFNKEASSFPLKKVGSDFIVFVKLNCAKRTKGQVIYGYDSEPEFYIFPTKLCEEYREKTGWYKVLIRNIPDYKLYKNNWKSISEALNM